jgi:hypothetical protein
MKIQNGYYKHYIPDIELSIERGTDQIPNDGKFYIISKRHVIDSFKTRKQAEEKFRQLVSESGYKPNTLEEKKLNAGDETIERYLISKAIFWAEGPKYKDKRGRGGRGGV